MIVSDLIIKARAGPPDPKPELGKPDEGGRSFQESLDDRIQDNLDSRNRVVGQRTKTKQAENQNQEQAEEKMPDDSIAVQTPVINPTPVNIIPLLTLQMQGTNGELTGEANQVVQASVVVQNTLGNIGDMQLNGSTDGNSKTNLSFQNMLSLNKTPGEGLEHPEIKLTETVSSPTQLVNTPEGNIGQVKINKLEIGKAGEIQDNLAAVDLGGDQLVLVDEETQTYAVMQALINKTDMPADKKVPAAIQQVGQGIQEMVEKGQGTLRLQLYPENMGRIELKLISGSEGVQVFLTADNPSTSRMLESNLNQLQQSMLAAGVKIGGMAVGTNNPQDNQSAGQHPKKHVPAPGAIGVSQVVGGQGQQAWQSINSISALDTRA